MMRGNRKQIKKDIKHCEQYHQPCAVRGFAKKKKSEITMEVDGWVQVSRGIFWENRPKIALNQY